MAYGCEKLKLTLMFAAGALLGACGSVGSSNRDAGAGGDAGTDAAADVGCGSLMDPHNCGRCGHDCTALQHVTQGSAAITCSTNGQCVVPPAACEASYGHCTTGADDGCETLLATSDHCGTCTTVCADPDPLCAAAGTSFACVNGCPSVDPTRCGNSCVDLTSDNSHCGSCTNDCTTRLPNPSGFTCSGNACLWPRYTVTQSSTVCSVGNVIVPCCRNGDAMVGFSFGGGNPSADTLYCSPVILAAEESCYLDSSSIAGATFNSRPADATRAMHACAVGYWMKGIDSSANTFVCCQGRNPTFPTNGTFSPSATETFETVTNCFADTTADVLTGVRIDRGQSLCAQVATF
jgi:hypothetical protein